MDIRQSIEYARFMRSIGWKVKTIDGVNVFIRRFLLIGSFIKIQRISTLPSISQINSLVKEERALKIVIEPLGEVCFGDLIQNGFKPTNPYAPSKTIQIDLTPSLDKIFSSFGKTARWTIKKAEKNNVMIKVGTINEFIKLKVSRFSPLRFSLEKMIHNIFASFSTDKAMVLIASKDLQLLGGVLLLFYDDAAYYWMSAANKEGKDLAAPSLLVWEALKLAKEKKCTVFDFEGVFDERFPKQTNSWKGFTKFKEGFGGKSISYPASLGKYFLPLFS